MLKSDNPINSRSERLFNRFIPERFLQGKHVFQAKVLWIYSIVLGTLGIVILMILAFKEGQLEARRVGTITMVACMLLLPILMSHMKRFRWVAAYAFFLTTAIVFYVDFNNQSILGPTLILWVVPIMLAGICFSLVQVIFSTLFILGLVLINIYFLRQGYLPEPIVQPENWPLVQVLYLCIAGSLLVVCTKGLTQVANRHFYDLTSELDNKQHAIEEISQLKIKAEAATKSKTMFLATMSHELRTPLNSVIGNAQLVARANLPESVKTQVNDIALAGNLLLMLINDILDFSQLEESGLKFIEQPYDLSRQMVELARMMQTKLKPDVDLQLQLPDSPIYFLADKNRVAQVLMNLLSNAMKFTEKGTIQFCLEVDQHQRIIIKVKDSGIGIAEDELPNLFKEFSQVSNNSTRNMEGTGLGLAIVQGIVQQMEGEIVVESELHVGSTFSVIFPNRLQADDIKIDGMNEVEVSNQLNLSTKRVLIVDDVSMNCTLLESMLLDLGAQQVASVNSGEASIEYLSQYPNTDMVLMDMRMPKMDGVEASLALRDAGYKGIIIAVTANASEDDKARCLSGGMNDFLSKPIALDELEKTLSKYT